MDDSRPQIGAPEAWERGFDGSGVTVAVLDSGYDAGHPDFAGQVSEAMSFVPDEDVHDHAGHGTHVASTVAGTGAASDGRYAGVAPGVDLAIGKVLNNSGWGQNSWIIAGMEWAAETADVVNMSLGAFPSDGTDPMSLAVDAISAETGTLFVIAAGNAGPDSSTVSTPAAADSALAVAAVDGEDQIAGFSSRGPRRGDHALKPEIAAPGSPVVAAWAAGSSPGPGTPVGEHYLAQSGTSMASPHVAGVAAMLLQKHPEWDAGQLKDALMSTAFDAGNDVYHQGAGRVDAARATGQDLYATGKVDFGFVRQPAPGDSAQAQTLTYRNTGETDLALELTVDVRGHGAPVGQDVLGLSAQTVVVPAGGQAEVDLTLDPVLALPGTYSGFVRATEPGGAEVNTVVAYAVEGPVYELTVDVTDRFAETPRSGSLVVQDLTDPDMFHSYAGLDDSGRAVFRVPAGDYTVDGHFSTRDPGRPDVVYSTDMFATTVIGVDRDMSVTIDGRSAVDIEFDVVGERRRTEATQVTQSLFRTSANGRRGGVTVLSDLWGSDARFGAIPADEPPAGSLSMTALTTWREPLITAKIEGQDSALWTVTPEWTGRFDGTRRLELVDVGSGRAEDYEGVDVRGKLAMVESDSYYVADQAATAQAHGAAAMLVVPESPGAVSVMLSSSNTLPVLGTTYEETTRLRERLGSGAVHLTLTGLRESTFTYTLRAAEDGAIPSDLGYTVKRSDLAAIENSFHSESERMGSALVTAYEAWQGGATRYFEPVMQPTVRTDYVVAGPDIRQAQQATSTQGFDAARLNGGETAYQPREKVSVSWFKAPSHPAGYTSLPCNFCRSEAILRFAPSILGDADPTHTGFGRMSTATTVYRDGERIERPELLLVPEPATYRIERVAEAVPDEEHLLANRSETAWTFRSEAPSALEIEGCRGLLPGANACAALPVILLGYDLPLGLDNHAPAGRTFNFVVRTDRAKGYRGPASVAGMEVSLSYDDGSTWEKAHTIPRPREGGFRVRAKHPKLSATNGYVSLRVEAWDDAGNRTVQMIERAYALS
nr:S8 family serine peptidase [Phytoactinopolyspora alkaliphila]